MIQETKSTDLYFQKNNNIILLKQEQSLKNQLSKVVWLIYIKGSNLSHGLPILKSLAFIFQSMLILSIHPCPFIVYYYLSCVFLF